MMSSPMSTQVARTSRRTRTVVYDAGGRDRIALSAWRAIWREVVDFRGLILRLVYRNVASQFRQSFLGYVWIALPPFATAVVFSLLRQSGIMRVEMAPGAMPYALFALVGATIWSFFTQVSIMATSSVFNAGTLVSKVYFPREVLVFSSVGNAIINLFVRIGVVALTCLLLGYAPHWQALFALLLLLPILALGLGIGFFLAPIHTMMNDTAKLLEFLLQFGMFLAPVVYPTPRLDEAETPWSQLLYWVHTANPVSHFMYAIHGLIERGAFAVTPWLIASTIFSFLVLLTGWRFFHVCEPLLAERI